MASEALTLGEVHALIRERIRANDGNQAATARAFGVTPGFLSMVLSGDREPSAGILRHLGLRRVVRYERVRAPRAPPGPAKPDGG